MCPTENDQGLALEVVIMPRRFKCIVKSKRYCKLKVLPANVAVY